jgi:hypothetical protein
VTVCIAALAADFRAVVCVADKALSYGDYIQWDSDSSKIIKVNPSGTLLLFSGEEEPGSKVLAGLITEYKELWHKDRPHIVKTCERQYKEALDELLEAKFLAPRLLKRSEYLSAITGATINEYMHSVAKEIDKYQMQCDLLVCGFDTIGTPLILELKHPGIATDMTITGFHAIGSGSEKAVARLLFSEHKRTHSLARTLYDLFDAKANAEMAVGVGYEWDAVIVMENGFHDVPENIKELIESVWAKYNRSPFETYNPKEDKKGPPKNWQSVLNDFSMSLSQKAKLFSASD